MGKVTIQTAIDEQVWVETKRAARDADIPLRTFITTALQEHLDRQRLTPTTRVVSVDKKGMTTETSFG